MWYFNENDKNMIFAMRNALVWLQIQAYIVEDKHKAVITCLEWSQNAMKLFSGDKAGCVVCTELDYTSVCI